jgi:hypothetical protein
MERLTFLPQTVTVGGTHLPSTYEISFQEIDIPLKEVREEPHYV